MTGRIPQRAALLVVAMLAAGALSALVAGAASAQLVYKNVPTPRPKAGFPALGFESDSVAEFGGEVEFAGTARENPTVTVYMESYACQTGSGAACTSTPGATFPVPITLSIYQVGSYGAPADQLTQTFNIPYRPSASADCPLELPEHVKGYGKLCAFAKTAKIKFKLLGATLPARAVLAVAYNTENYGKEPTGVGGPYNSLNVAVNANYVCAPGKENPVTKECEGEDYINVSTEAPSVGADPLPEQVFLNTTYSAIDCGGTLGSFGPTGIEPTCNWKFEQPAFEVKAK
ncbi:MAG TPA: hypothetical protein VKG38_11500 [Solirubrobacteraceae bacterium]|nr:hypothetical protein [Solirubrobacteraceae bacterium]